MKPRYANNEVYSLIASWAENCGFEIRYKKREGEKNLAYTRPNEYGESYIQMYNNEEIYIPVGELYLGPNCCDEYYAEVGSANVLGHELAHQIFTNVSCEPFARLFGIEPKYTANTTMINNEDACDAFGNFLYTLAKRITDNRPFSEDELKSYIQPIKQE